MNKNIYKKTLFLRKTIRLFAFSFLFFNLTGIFCAIDARAQMYPAATGSNMMPGQQTTSYAGNSNAFKQEIARLEINVVREGKMPLPITSVPRLEKGDVLKVRLLDEQVNGLKPDQSNFDWTFLVAFINPGRNNDAEKTVSEEINFKRRGWYKEYSFVVPYDSQPIFFLYPKPQYRAKFLNLINKNQDDIRKIGEKTIEIADAYAKIGSFLNELQTVVNNNYYLANSYPNYNYSMYSPYGIPGTYNNYNYNRDMFSEQVIERLAKSFNISMPGCWNNSSQYSIAPTYAMGSYINPMTSGMDSDFIGRVQCVAKGVSVADFDISMSRMLQEGGVLAAAQLAQRYPQMAFWINMAAAAVDFILKLTNKIPLRIVPAIISTSDNQGQNALVQNNNMPAGMSNPVNQNVRPDSVKISLFAESQPGDSEYVTAYPIVVNKWQANPDPNVISLPVPALMDPCLHAGQNILQSTDLINDWMSDNFTKDFKLVVSSPNGFTKEFPLKKNIGLSGWELNVTKEDFNAFPKINMNLEAEIIGKRGFNEIKSPKFQLALPISGNWEVAGDTQKAFAVGGKRTVKLVNQFGSCKCLQAVIYKPSFGGQFVFEVKSKTNPLLFSEDGKEVTFEVDTTNFQPGDGQFELRTFGGETSNLNINLYPMPPNVTNVRISKGDNKAIVTGIRLEQIQALKINGKRAVVQGNNMIIPANNQNNPTNANPMTAPALSEKTFVFEDPSAHQDTNTFSIELELEGNRTYQYPKTFNLSPARPVLVSHQVKEIEAIASGNKTKSQFALDTLPIFPIDSSKISLIVQNALTDYDFKIENLEVETRIENSQINSTQLPKINFEVLDWKNMQITFQLNEELQRLLGGRRLQFRIRDKERGDSDWYTIGKTFARLPANISVKCTSQMNGNCEMKGDGIEYISQVSVDGGKSWYPQAPASLTVQSTGGGEKAVLIPRYSNRNLLQIRLRDFPMTEGLAVHDYSFENGNGHKN